MIRYNSTPSNPAFLALKAPFAIASSIDNISSFVISIDSCLKTVS